MKIGSSALYYAAAVTTAIAGILHLMLVPSIIGWNPNSGIFFIISGIAQIFGVIPMLKRWGRIWYYIGIAGTIILIIMWAITRMPGNPITGRGVPISDMAIIIAVTDYLCYNNIDNNCQGKKKPFNLTKGLN